MFINDEQTSHDDNSSVYQSCYNDIDPYNFSFTNVGIKTHEITPTQKLILSQKTRGKKINQNWILLDSQSTISILNNRNLVTNIRKCKPSEKVQCFCNGGYQDTDQIATVEGLGTVYFNLKSLANILSLADVYEKCRVTLDTDIEEEFIVHNTKYSKMKFVRNHSGLHYYNVVSEKKEGMVMIQTVQNNKSSFTKRELLLAEKAKELYKAIGRPG